jgi:hypothetical protein
MIVLGSVRFLVKLLVRMTSAQYNGCAIKSISIADQSWRLMVTRRSINLDLVTCVC